MVRAETFGDGAMTDAGDLTAEMHAPPEGAGGLSSGSLSNMPVALVLTDPNLPDNPIVYVNRAFTALTGYAADAATGRNCRFLQGKGTQPEVVRRVRAAIEAREPVTVDLLNYRADGSRFQNRLMVTPLYDEGGKVTHFLGVQSVRTDERDLEDEVAELDVRLRELQHRVKNHLSMILSMIRSEARGSERPRYDARGAFEVLAGRVEALSLLYEKFTEAEAPGAGTVALGAYLSRVCAATQQLVDARTVRVNVDMCEADADAETAARLGLFLSEVLDNALQHAFPSGVRGRVEASLVREGGDLVLRVEDDGQGMERGDWPSERSLGGRIVKALTERMNAELDVRSDEDGTVVELRLPDPAPPAG